MVLFEPPTRAPSVEGMTKGPETVKVVVATLPSVSGQAPDEVQYGSPPMVGVVEVEMVPTPEPEAEESSPSQSALEPVSAIQVARLLPKCTMLSGPMEIAAVVEVAKVVADEVAR